MTSLRHLLVTALASAALAGLPAGAQELPRKAVLGARLAPVEGGVRIEAIFPGGTLTALRVRPGDLITALNGVPTPNVAALLQALARLETGAPVALSGTRGGKPFHARGRAAGRPLERYTDATVTYGAVPFRGGLLRDIMVTPDAVKAPPVVLHIQGFTCASIEPGFGDSLYTHLASDLSEAGIAFYRVEKPGVGDSRGGLDCREIGFADELDSFRTAYRHLVEKLGVAPDRIFMLGHSMGGIQAPLLAAENPPRGVAVFGTVMRDWLDYSEELDLFQNFLMNGTDPVREYEKATRNRELLRLFYREKKTPQELVAIDPAYGPALQELLDWDGGTLSYGRHYRFLQDTAGQPLIPAWSNTQSEVLSLYGESDMVAVFGTDQRMIADVVNYYRPGTARFVEVPGTMHGMDYVGDRETFRRNAIAGDNRPTRFNPQVSHILIEWIRAAMAKPPVRERTFPDALAKRVQAAKTPPQ